MVRPSAVPIGHADAASCDYAAITVGRLIQWVLENLQKRITALGKDIDLSDETVRTIVSTFERYATATIDTNMGLYVIVSGTAIHCCAEESGLAALGIDFNVALADIVASWPSFEDLANDKFCDTKLMARAHEIRAKIVASDVVVAKLVAINQKDGKSAETIRKIMLSARVIVIHRRMLISEHYKLLSGFVIPGGVVLHAAAFSKTMRTCEGALIPLMVHETEHLINRSDVDPRTGVVAFDFTVTTPKKKSQFTFIEQFAETGSLAEKAVVGFRFPFHDSDPKSPVIADRILCQLESGADVPWIANEEISEALDVDYSLLLSAFNMTPKDPAANKLTVM